MPLKKYMMKALDRYRKYANREHKPEGISPSMFDAAEKIKKRKKAMAAQIPK
jgi:hypothetical protein